MKIKWKGFLGFGTITLVTGGCWFVNQLFSIKETLNQAMPMHILAGLHKYPVYIYLPEDAVLESEEENFHWGVQNAPRFPMADGFLWKSIQPRTSWELVYLAKSKERHHRIFGLRLLSSLHSLNDGICREIAQASDFQMAVGLARCKSCDLRLLLPPPSLPPILQKSELQDDLCAILKGLPGSDRNNCAAYLTSLTLEQIQSSQELEGREWWCSGGVEESPKKLRKPTKENLIMMFLQSLLVHSTIKEHRDVLIRLRTLPVLMKLYNDKTWTTNTKIQSLIANVLGNLALEETFHNAIFQSGWISVLAEWSRNSDVELALSSERVLANLDRLNGPNKFEDGIYVAHPCHIDGDPKAVFDVVFIHGLLGGAFKTWRQHDKYKNSANILSMGSEANTHYTYCWPRDWLAADLPRIRIILMDYETHLTEWSSRCPFDSKERTLEARSKHLLDKLTTAGVGRRPILWISHSMGGLLMKQMLILSQNSDSPQIQQLFKQTKGAIFFSVPHRGSKIAMPHFGSKYITFPSPEVKQLHYESKQLLELHEKFMKLIADRHVPCLSFCETKDTKLGQLNLSARFVTQESAKINSEEFHSMDTDHLYICKPATKNSFIYERVVQFISEQIKHFENENHSEILETIGIS